MEKVTLAVKDLVNYVYAAGDLSSQSQGQNRAYIGTQIHQHRQASYGPEDLKEMRVDGDIDFDDITYHLVGRMDGLLLEDGERIIEEIKSTTHVLEGLQKPLQETHLRQLMVYGFLYAKAHQLETITLRLLYIHYPSMTQKAFTQTYDYAFLAQEAYVALETYRAWHEKILAHLWARERTLEGLKFPFIDIREGQALLIEKTYEAMIDKDILYASAPTGIGKTMATLYGALKTIHRYDEKIFYATAKNAGKQVARQMVEKVKDEGLALKAITLNSKESLCLRDEVDCDPAICPFAKDYYDRVNEALKDVFTHDVLYDGPLLKQYGAMHKICPHELALDVARYCDVIIGDFNYAFDPRIQLVRFFEEDDYKIKLLVDEAHNLIDRSRSMYSTALSYEEIKRWHHHLDTITPSPHKALTALKEAAETILHQAAKAHQPMVAFKDVPKAFHKAIEDTYKALEILMDQHKQHRLRSLFKDAFFEVLQWLRIAHYYEEAHVFLVHHDRDDVRFEMACLDASKPLKETMTQQVESAVLFSATLEPLNYHQDLLTQGLGRTLILPSPYDPRRLGLFVDHAPSIRYRDRRGSIERIQDSIYALLEGNVAPYIVYFPSFTYLQEVLEGMTLNNYEVLRHKPGMTPLDKDALLTQFSLPSSRSKVLFTVLGGSFAEGVDLPLEQLRGVMVIGVALPALSSYQKLLQQYYTHKGFDGFHYAFTYPGMNRVIQAVGRVIRTERDYGVAVLLDDRYQTPLYQSLMPDHWEGLKTLEKDDYLQGFLQQFWQSFKGEDSHE